MYMCRTTVKFVSNCTVLKRNVPHIPRVISAFFLGSALIPDSGDSSAPFFLHLAVPFFAIKGLREVSAVQHSVVPELELLCSFSGWPALVTSTQGTPITALLPKNTTLGVCCCSCLLTLTPDVYVRLLYSAHVCRSVLIQHGNCFFSCSATFLLFFFFCFASSGRRMDLHEHLLGVRVAAIGGLCGRRGLFQ